MGSLTVARGVLEARIRLTLREARRIGGLRGQEVALARLDTAMEMAGERILTKLAEERREAREGTGLRVIQGGD